MDNEGFLKKNSISHRYLAAQKFLAFLYTKLDSFPLIRKGILSAFIFGDSSTGNLNLF